MGNQVFKSLALGLVLGFLACGFLPAAHAVTLENPGPSLNELLKNLGYEARTAELREDDTFETEAGLSCKNCDQDGFIKKENIAVIGEVDTRTLPASKLTSAEQTKYNGIGAVFCGGRFVGTGFLIFSHIFVTAAHTLAHARGSDTYYSPQECDFRLLGTNPQELPVEFAKMHIHPEFKNDFSGRGSSSDVAVIELKYRFLEHVNTYVITVPIESDIDKLIQIVGYHEDLTPKNRSDITAQQNKRKTFGPLFEIQGTSLLAGRERLYGHCADMNGGSSGAPVIAADERIIGVNIGGYTSPGLKDCNKAVHMNLAMLFDADVINWMKKALGIK